MVEPGEIWIETILDFKDGLTLEKFCAAPPASPIPISSPIGSGDVRNVPNVRHRFCEISKSKCPGQY